MPVSTSPNVPTDAAKPSPASSSTTTHASPLHLTLNPPLTTLRHRTTATTSRLDSTYYSLLSNLLTLQHTLSSLQSLLTTSASLPPQFTHSSQTLIHDTQIQLADISDFSEQRLSLSSLELRIQESRIKAEAAVERLDNLRRRAEGWSTVEAQWEDRTRKRIKLFWAFSAFAAGVLVLGLLVVFVPRGLGGGDNRTVPRDVGMTAGAAAGAGNGIGGVMEGTPGGVGGKEVEKRVLEELLRGREGERGRERDVLEGIRRGGVRGGGGGGERGEGDERLRIFDEL